MTNPKDEISKIAKSKQRLLNKILGVYNQLALSFMLRAQINQALIDKMDMATPLNLSDEDKEALLRLSSNGVQIDMLNEITDLKEPINKLGSVDNYFNHK